MELLKHKKTASIDLLKDEEQVKASANKKLAIKICLFIVLLIAIFSVGIFTYNLNQRLQIDSVKAEIEEKTASWQKLEPVGTSIKTITAKNQVIVSTRAKYSGIEPKLNKIRSSVPSGISLTNLTLNNLGKTVISGKALDAAVIYQFYELLKADKEIQTPILDSLMKSSADYSFTISMTVLSK